MVFRLPGFLSFSERNNFLYLQIFNHKIEAFTNLSLGFILELFLKFRNFQPRYSYEKYCYIKNRVYEN